MLDSHLDDITAVCEEQTRMSDPNILLIIHAGTNEAMNTRSKELLQKRRQMIQQNKSKFNKIILSSKASLKKSDPRY